MENIKAETMGKQAKSELIIFVHIPKTAGTSLRGIIEKNFKKDAIFTVDGRNPQKSIALFNNLSSDKKLHFSLVQGHVEFGALRPSHEQIKYITFVRNPVERVLSYYSYILSDTYRRPQAEIAAGMPFKDYLLSKYDWQIDNHQTRMIAGNVPPEYGACTSEVLERAKANLASHFEFVGIADLFDRSVLAMSKSLGWNTPFYKRLNATKKRISKKGIGQEELNIIVNENRFDWELYQFATSRFEGMHRKSRLQAKTFQIINKIRQSYAQ
jgi:hypothetical protein